jgi:beta-xylosidase
LVLNIVLSSTVSPSTFFLSECPQRIYVHVLLDFKFINMSSTFTNPLIWEDLPDPELLRVGNTYYMSASSFHFSPGAPILQSPNLIDWTYIGHSVPTHPPPDRFTLDPRRPTAYGKGVWASTMKYRASNGLFYFYSAIQGTDNTYVWTARNPAGVWSERGAIERFYYDLGLLVDDDDTMYIAHGTKTIQVARLDDEGVTEVESRVCIAPYSLPTSSPRFTLYSFANYGC